MAENDHRNEILFEASGCREYYSSVFGWVMVVWPPILSNFHHPGVVEPGVQTGATYPVLTQMIMMEKLSAQH